MKYLLKTLLITLLIASCKTDKSNTVIAEVNQETLSKHIEILASDDFQGRMPFTEGGQKTTKYLKQEFERLGLLPGNGASYFQDVPMVEISGTPSDKMEVSGKNLKFDLDLLKDFVVTTSNTDTEVSLVNSELVFAGFGIVAPEYGWNDYEGIDWKGKTAVVLVNDPGFKSGDKTLFKGNEMTYYGRWTYKFEEAARQGAAGILIIHDTEPASYGWNVVQSGWSGAHLTLESDSPKVDVQGWISNEAANKLFESSSIKNKNYNELAKSNGFSAVSFGLNASVKIKNKIKRDQSKNVVALLPGTDLKEEYIIYSAHWDHLGVGRPIDNDSIYNGAVDNASGTAALLAIAEAFKNSPQQKRSIVLLAVTAEEQGLLGSAYYSEHPIYEPSKTVANINMDAFNSPGPMKDFTITGFGHSEMDEYGKAAAEAQGRYIIPDPSPEKGYFFRSDHFNFAKIGIPPIYAKGGHEGFDISIDSMKVLNDTYRKSVYHQPSDEYIPGVTDLSGIRFDVQLLFNIGYKLSNETYFPKWYDGSEFKAARE
ncbi:MAG: M28 family metallopeptidase [Urechidicola sp.]